MQRQTDSALYFNQRMQVLWLEQTVADVRGEADWLSPAETARLIQMRVSKRGHDWQLGRWTAKQSIAICD